MAREIKFRAWDKVNERMFDGWNIDGSATGSFDGGYFGALDMLYSSVEGFDAEELGREGWDYRKASEVELMQYTGLKDKNGIEIFEGDIVSDEFDRYLLIEFFKGSFGTRGDRYTTHINCDWIVVGNIYENPELLETK